MRTGPAAAKPLLRVLGGMAIDPPPIWLMRQAGRYLPEYRELRQRVPGFLELCFTPELAAEATLQPVRRYAMDAAILFSDILVVPHGLGQAVSFREGEGPVLAPIRAASELRELAIDDLPGRVAPVYETLRRVGAVLPADTALIGFAGAPWTLATYMAAGRGGDEQRAAKLWGYRDPDGFQQLLELLVDCVAAHLTAQIEAGANAVQLFDSWAGGLPEEAYAQWVVEPTKRIVRKVRNAPSQAKIIGFPRASTLAGYSLYAAETGVDAVSVDTGAPVSWMRDCPDLAVVQGNLDPLLLFAGGKAMRNAVDKRLEAMRGRPFIFNLGHGVLPDTPPEHVAELVALVRQPR